MKLERAYRIAIFALVSASAAGIGGCATATPPRAPVQSSASVSTTRMNAAVFDTDEGAPRVGKSQLSTPSTAEPTEEKSEERPRRDDGRRGGGFSGWK